MSNHDWVHALFAAIDRKDAAAFAGYLAEDVMFRFGNAPASHGRDAARVAVESFFAGVAAVRHELQNTWQCAGHVLCRGRVTYTRADNSMLTVPFANVFLMAAGKIREYEIYADVSALFAA